MNSERKIKDTNTQQQQYKKTKKIVTNLIDINSLHTNTQGACGYCQGQKSGKFWVTSGFECEQMGLEEYQKLLDRGWRRCGSYFYKPQVEQCCCQPYPLRTHFKIQDSFQNKTKLFQKYLNYEENNQKNKEQQKRKSMKLTEIISSSSEDDDSDDEQEKNQNNFVKNDNKENQQEKQDKSQQQKDSDNESNNSSSRSSSSDTSQQQQKSSKQIEKDNQKREDKFNKQILKKNKRYIDRYHEQIKFTLNEFVEIMKVEFPKYAKDFQEILNLNDECNLEQILEQIWIDQSIRRTEHKRDIQDNTDKSNVLYIFYKHLKKQVKLKQKPDEFIERIKQKVMEIINKAYDQNICLHDLRIGFYLGSITFILVEQEKKITSALQCVFDYQKKLIDDMNQQKVKEKKLQQLNKCIPEKRRVQSRQIVPAKFEEETFKLYKKYLQVIHKKSKISQQSYKNFLCTQALETRKETGVKGVKEKNIEFGCYHIKHYIDNELKYVSVVDILPNCMSLVYNFYHPSFRKYSIGIVSSLKDLKYIEEQQEYFPNFQYYYLGYYIGTCPKMEYKSSYTPCELLCPVTYKWVEFITKEEINKKVAQIINEGTYSLAEGEQEQIQEIQYFVKKQLRLNIGGKLIRLSDIRQGFVPYYENLLTKLVRFIGQDLAQKFIFGQA